MRARNLKPTLFKNEVLGTGPNLAIPFYLGLMAMADRKGVVEDRPLRSGDEGLPDSIDDGQVVLG